MTIEHQSCDKCGNEMGYHQVGAIKPKSVTRLCKACSMAYEFDTRQSLKLPSGGDLAPLFDTESIKTISDAVKSL